MTQDHGDAGGLVPLLHAMTKHSPDTSPTAQAMLSRIEQQIRARDPFLLRDISTLIRDQQAEIEFLRVNYNTEVANKVHFSLRAEAAVPVVEAAREYERTNDYQTIRDTLAAYDKTTATLETRAAAESFLDGMGKEVEP